MTDRSGPLSFVVHGTPAPAGSKKGFYNPKARRVIITDDSKRSRPWKAQVADAAGQAMQDRELLQGPLLLDVTFWMPRPKSHYGTGRNAAKVKDSAASHPAVKPDLTKLLRAVEDACNGVVWRDDAQICVQTVQKAYGASARMELRVVPILQPAEAVELARSA